MEITCDDSVQCIALFEPRIAHGAIERIYGILPNIAKQPSELGCLPETSICGKSLPEVIQTVSSDAVLGTQTIIIPNATPGGHKTVLRKGWHARFAELDADGLYVDKAITVFDKNVGDLRAIRGEDPNWGTKRRGVVATGDNRTATFDQLGAAPCWIRLGEPTVEAVRQAFLADQARIAYSEPAYPSDRVLDLYVKSTLVGSLSISLNDGLNAIIGGRGSGKTALLEYLRFGLGRSTGDVNPRAAGGNREHELVAQTLRDGLVIVKLERHGVRESWRRDLTMGGKLEITPEGGEPELVPLEEAWRRFPARGFHQKQLSTLVVNRESAFEQVTGVAVAEATEQLSEADRKLSERYADVRETVFQLQRALARRKVFRKVRAARADLKRQLEAQSQLLALAGVSKEDQKLLADVPMFMNTQDQLISRTRALTELRNAVQLTNRQLLKAFGPLSESAADYFPLIRELNSALAVRSAEAESIFGSLQDLLTKVSTRVDDAQKQFTDLSSTQHSLVELARGRQAQHQRIIADVASLQKQDQAFDKEETMHATAEEDVAQALSKLVVARNALNDQQYSRRAILEDAASKAMRMSGDSIRASVAFAEVSHSFASALQAIAENTGIRDQDTVIATRAKELSLSPVDGWRSLGDQLVEVFVARSDAYDDATKSISLPSGIADAIRTVFGAKLTDRQVDNLTLRLDENRLAQVLNAPLDWHVRFEYKDQDGYIDFEKASPGQQAGALLKLLLAQEAGTLIIDQPEDDLDNRAIMEICRTLQQTKQHRQLVFSTHNANLVVNGDADKIVVLKPVPTEPEAQVGSRVSVEADGAIETEAVKSAVTELMEGGRKAFALRARKYSYFDN